MKHLGILRQEANEACAARGHKVMEWSAPYHGESRSLQHASCSVCGLEVHIRMNPLPNEIEVGGEAVALNCGNKFTDAEAQQLAESIYQSWKARDTCSDRWGWFMVKMDETDIELCNKRQARDEK